MFLDLIGAAYGREVYYKEKGCSPPEILAGRQSAETEAVVEKLLRLLKEELAAENPSKGYYMQQALDYFDRFKDGLLRYRTGAIP